MACSRLELEQGGFLESEDGGSLLLESSTGACGGFRTPLSFWNAGASGVQGGFRTPIPTFPAGTTAVVIQGGYKSLLAFWLGGAVGGEAEPEPEAPIRGGGGPVRFKREVDLDKELERLLKLEYLREEDEEMIKILYFAIESGIIKVQ